MVIQIVATPNVATLSAVIPSVEIHAVAPDEVPRNVAFQYEVILNGATPNAETRAAVLIAASPHAAFLTAVTPASATRSAVFQRVVIQTAVTQNAAIHVVALIVATLLAAIQLAFPAVPPAASQNSASPPAFLGRAARGPHEDFREESHAVAQSLSAPVVHSLVALHRCSPIHPELSAFPVDHHRDDLQNHPADPCAARDVSEAPVALRLPTAACR